MSDKHLTPVILLVFSNSKDDYLKNLVEEEKDILKSLQDHDDRGYIQVHRVAHTEIKDIFDDVNRYSERIAIFHYAGHAGDSYLQLQDEAGEEKKASVKGLAQLLGRQPALQLVFLNGCATRGWIERLFEAGVKAVVATTVKIDDRQATDFAEQFYRALAAGKQGIKNAFETAKNFLESDAAHQGEIGIHDMAEATRGGDRNAQSKETGLPWGLYINKDAEAVLDWRLPDAPQSVSVSISVPKAATANAMLLELLPAALTSHHEEMAAFMIALKKGRQDAGRLPGRIISCFPVPVGIQLSKLFMKDTDYYSVSEARLGQLMITYEVITQLIAFAALSHLWNLREDPKQGEVGIPDAVNDFVALNGDHQRTFDYIRLTEAVLKMTGTLPVEPYVAELKALDTILQQEDLQQAHRYMEDLRGKYGDGAISAGAGEITELCLSAESALATVLAAFAFIAGYIMTTIREIKVIKYRHKKDPQYQHNQVILDDTMNQDVALDSLKAYADCSESQSVILLKSLNEIYPYLSLSPFIIDENALSDSGGGREAKLFFYQYSDNAGAHYRLVNKWNAKDERDRLIISPTHYGAFKEQLDAFRKAMAGARDVSKAVG